MGIDYTKSNTWTGKRCFNGRCLHETSGQMNPYQVGSTVATVLWTLRGVADILPIPRESTVCGSFCADGHSNHRKDARGI